MAPSENPCFFLSVFFFFLVLLLGGLCCFLVVVVVVVGLMHLLLRALIMVKLELAMSVHKLNNYWLLIVVSITTTQGRKATGGFPQSTILANPRSLLLLLLHRHSTPKLVHSCTIVCLYIHTYKASVMWVHKQPPNLRVCTNNKLIMCPSMLVLWRVQNAKNPYPNGGKLDLFFLATKQRFGVFYFPQKP